MMHQQRLRQRFFFFPPLSWRVFVTVGNRLLVTRRWGGPRSKSRDDVVDSGRLAGSFIPVCGFPTMGPYLLRRET